MNKFKKTVSVLAIAVIMLVSLGAVATATSPETQTVTATPGQTVTIALTESDCYGVSGSIAFDNRELFSSVKPVDSPYGQINESSFILSSSDKIECTVAFEVTVSETATVGSKCTVSFKDYLRVDNNSTLEGPDGLLKTVTVEVVEPAPVVEIVDTSKIFKDIKVTGWYKSYVDYAYSYGIFTGMSDTEFCPDANITRAQFVQVLANLEGVDTSNRNVTTIFSDVPAKKWYTAAIKWASETKVVSGIGGGKFAPDALVTREQMCLMITKYADYKEVALTPVEEKTIFADDAKISRWAKAAVYVCQQADIVNGKGANTFDPKGTGTRAQATVMFAKLHKDYLAK